MLAPVLPSFKSAESFPLNSLTMLRLILPGINNALTKSGDYFIILFQFLRWRNWSFISLRSELAPTIHAVVDLPLLTVHQCDPSRSLYSPCSLWGMMLRNYLVNFENRLYPQSKLTSFQVFFYYFQNRFLHVFANCRPITN